MSIFLYNRIRESNRVGRALVRVLKISLKSKVEGGGEERKPENQFQVAELSSGANYTYLNPEP